MIHKVLVRTWNYHRCLANLTCAVLRSSYASDPEGEIASDSSIPRLVVEVSATPTSTTYYAVHPTIEHHSANSVSMPNLLPFSRIIENLMPDILRLRAGI